MKRLQDFKFRLRPTKEQERLLRQFTGSCRFVWNRALALQKERHERKEKRLGYADLCRLLTAWRHDEETAWLAEAPSQAIQQSLKDLERAYARFFSGLAELPKFKKKSRCRESFRFPDPKQIVLDQANSRIKLPKLGWIRYRNSREVLGELRNVTVGFSCGGWFVSIQTEREAEPAIPKGDAVGIDMGVARFATLSDGTFLEPLSSFKKHEKALRKAQQSLSHKLEAAKEAAGITKGQKIPKGTKLPVSNNRRKSALHVAKIHERIANVRLDFLHKASTAIGKNHAMVVVEALNIKGMSKSASGTLENPGRNVLAKSGLNRAILDQGWGEFRRQLAYKLNWNGGLLIAVPPANTSRTCPECGHVSKDNRPTQARFSCIACGYAAHADLVGAVNILRAGHARIACGVNPERGQQQEPAGALACAAGIAVL